MAFMNELYKQMTQEKQTTENGAIGYRTSGKQLLDANFAVSSMRDWGNERIRQMFTKVYYENPLLAVKWLFISGMFVERAWENVIHSESV